MGTRGNPIVLDDNEEAPRSQLQLQLEHRLDHLRLYHNEYQCGSDRSGGIDEDPEVHVIEDDEERLEEVRDFIDLTTADEDPVHRTERTAKPSVQRNSTVKYPYAVRPSCLHPHFGTLKVGMTVELAHMEETLFFAEFVLIRAIIQAPDGTYSLRGLPFARTRYVADQLPRQRNEVCLILLVDADDDRPDKEQAMVEMSLDDIIATRKLVVTNAHMTEFFKRQLLPNFTYREYPEVFGHLSKHDIEKLGTLTCRWVRKHVYRDGHTRLAQRPPLEFALIHLDEGGIRSLKGTCRTKLVQDTLYRDMWRVDGAATGTSRYTFGDMFCGAGGASQGAKKAGFKVVTACDLDSHASKTYAANFPTTRLHHMDIFNLLTSDELDARLRPDAMHMSPPCQFWSPAHTIAGMNDNANINALFACETIIQKYKPRLFTLEQTFGILFSRHAPFFNTLIHGYTKLGYSVRWKLVMLQDFGLASRRTRLIIMGSCPGMPLPDFPLPTHSAQPQPGDGTRQYVGAGEALRDVNDRLSRFDPLHNIGSVKRMNNTPWKKDEPLANCITCDGGNGKTNYHWTGKRGFTLREFATLQGFPLSFGFEGSRIKKQIGNAFAPVVVQTFYEHLSRHLRLVDRPGNPLTSGGNHSLPSIEMDDGFRPEDDDAELVLLNSQSSSRTSSPASSCTLGRSSGEEDNDVLMCDAPDPQSPHAQGQGSSREQAIVIF